MSTNASVKVIIAAFIGNSVIAVTRFIAAFTTGSSAMRSAGIHSLVDTGNQVLLLYGMKQAKKRPMKPFHSGMARKSISGVLLLLSLSSRSDPVFPFMKVLYISGIRR